MNFFIQAGMLALSMVAYIAVVVFLVRQFQKHVVDSAFVRSVCHSIEKQVIRWFQKRKSRQ